MKKLIYTLGIVILFFILSFTNILIAQEDEGDSTNVGDNPIQNPGNNPNQNPGRNSLIDSVINLVTTQSVGDLANEITGNVEVNVGGSPVTIETRYAYTNSNKKAKEYIYEKLASYGLTASYDNYSANGTNVIGKKTGSKFPNQQYIVCCHFDDMPPVTESTKAPGADDNGSGVVGILEAARLLANYNLDYTVLFIAFDEEEIDILGSKAYADNAYTRGDAILGVINLDMIAYDKNNDGKFEVLTNAVTAPLADEYISVTGTYVPGLTPVKDLTETGSSDHISFNKKGYKAMHLFEDSREVNPNMHSAEDKFINCNATYLQNIVKSVIAFVIFKGSL